MVLFLFSATLTSGAWAQVVGTSIFGTVEDESGAGLPQATVAIRNLETGALRTLATDEAGRYAAPSITVGPYQISASKEGFAPQTKTGIDLVVGQSMTVNFKLSVGELQQAVTVEESPLPVSLSTQPTSGLVNERQVKELPLNGRSYDSLMALNPAVVNYTSERSGGVGTSNSAVGNMFTVSGRRPQENLFLLNGIEFTGASEINNTPGGTSGQLLGVEAVREFNVVTDAYGAEYGKRPGVRSASLRHRDPINSMAPFMSFCATARWTRETSSTRGPFRGSRETSSAWLAADRSGKTSCLSSEITKASVRISVSAT